MTPGTGLVLADGAGSMPERIENFGRCLFGAIRDLLAGGHAGACVLNSDGPNLPTGYLVRAAAVLSAPGDRMVLGHADDGGYYLLGLKRPHPELFQDIPWSTPAVHAATLARAAASGLEVVELPRWHDVDDEPSLRRLVGDLSDPGSMGYEAPATRRRLTELGLAVQVPGRRTG